jgi:hypothetical protein
MEGLCEGSGRAGFSHSQGEMRSQESMHEEGPGEGSHAASSAPADPQRGPVLTPAKLWRPADPNAGSISLAVQVRWHVVHINTLSLAHNAVAPCTLSVYEDQAGWWGLGCAGCVTAVSIPCSHVIEASWLLLDPVVSQPVQETAMAGLPMLLTAVLLHAAPSCTPAEAVPERLPPNFVESALLVMRVLNNIAR